MMKKTQTMSVTSGKGGVGKTTVTANLALSFARAGESVLIFDGDMGMANVDIFFGVRPEGSLHDVFTGKRTMAEILVPVADGVHLLPGGSGLADLQNMNNFQRRSMLEAVSDLPHRFDRMIIDTAPGIADNVLYLNSAADQILVVLTPDPASLTDGYALIKVLNQKCRQTKFSILCNQVRDDQDGLALYHRFREVVDRFLDVGLDYAGALPNDPILRKSNQMQRLVLRHEPQAPSSVAFRALSARLSKDLGRNETKGGMQFFWQQAVGMA